MRYTHGVRRLVLLALAMVVAGTLSRAGVAHVHANTSHLHQKHQHGPATHAHQAPARHHAAPGAALTARDPAAHAIGVGGVATTPAARPFTLALADSVPSVRLPVPPASSWLAVPIEARQHGPPPAPSIAPRAPPLPASAAV